jgi:general secretion pathway protein D
MVSGLAMSLATAQDRPVITLPAPGGTGGGDTPTKVEPFRTGLEETDTRTTPPGARVSFNLEDADLPDLVRIVSRITGKRFILPSKARSIKATVYSPSDVTAAEAYQAFLSILSLNGLSLEPSGRYYKIIETSGAESHGFPMYEDGETMPADDRFVTRMHRVANVSAEDVATLLTHFKTAEGAITAYAPTNTLIITDTAANVRRMLRIVSQIDIPRTGEQIWVEPIHYAVATDLAERLREVYPVEEEGSAAAAPAAEGRRGRRGAAKAPTTREGEAPDAAATPTSSTVGASSGGEARVRNIIADERTNSLIIMATERAYLQLLELIRVLDVAVEGEGSVHVYELQYADAENMAEVLGSLIEGGGSSSSGSGGAAATKRAAAATAGEGADAIAGSFSGGDISIAAYKETNALIVTASATDYAALRRVITELDVAPRQVFIEAVIMELQIQRSSRLGVSYHGGLPEPNIDGSAGLSVLGFGAANSIGFPASALAGDTLTGLALGVRGPNLPTIPGIGLSIPSFGVVLSALADSSDSDVLATPHLLAMDNIEAVINVGANVPLQTSGLGGALGNSLSSLAGGAGANAAGGLAGLAGLSGLAGGLGGGGVQRQNVGIILTMTPHINDAGEIRLEIEMENSEPGAAVGTLGVVPIQQTTATTQVLVRDQETVVIGGLMRDRVTTTETKVPILGDIPILGALFRTTSRTTERRNLLLFLTPYIIRGPDDLRAIFERKMQERQEFLDRFFVFGDHEYTPPFDYSRTRGLVLEIFNELEDVDEERVLEAELESRPPPEHTARAPLGVASPFDDALGAEGDLVIGPEGELDLSEPAPVVAEPVVEEGAN